MFVWKMWLAHFSQDGSVICRTLYVLSLKKIPVLIKADDYDLSIERDLSLEKYKIAAWHSIFIGNLVATNIISTSSSLSACSSCTFAEQFVFKLWKALWLLMIISNQFIKQYRELDQVVSSTERLSVKVQQDSLFVDLNLNNNILRAEENLQFFERFTFPTQYP